LLQVSGIECGYDGGKVFDGVSMTVERGEIVALIDRNGVGKTTLMRALTRPGAAAWSAICRCCDGSRLQPLIHARDDPAFAP
jgi:ABC-type branched-subunit amino acid transport system ATPase component